MKKKVYIVLVFLIMIAFTLIVGFVLDTKESLKIANEGLTPVIYWVGKGFAILAMLVMIYNTIKENDYANKFVFLRLTMILQFLPLLLRLLFMVKVNGESLVVIPVILVSVVIIGYVAIFFLVDVNNDSVKKTLPRLEGKKIPVEDSQKYYDDEGNFIGAKGKDKHE